MKRPFHRIIAVLAVLAGLASCGWMEVPYESGARRAGSDPLFVGAGAVTVGKGDTVYAISRRHKVSMRAIIEANGLRAPYVLLVGQKLILPRAQEYAVQRGDTLSVIAERHRVSLYQTAQLNGLKAPYVIRVGQVLHLPSSRKIETATRVQIPAPQPAPTAPSAAPSIAPSIAPSALPSGAGQGFLWPVQGRLVDAFGPKAQGLQNDGINIAAPRGSPVKASENGIVAYAGDGLKGFGNLVLVRHADGWVTAYAHADTVLVRRGDEVKRGQTIAQVGSTGTVTTPQLHFEMRREGRAVDPALYLPRGSA